MGAVISLKVRLHYNYNFQFAITFESRDTVFK